MPTTASQHHLTIEPQDLVSRSRDGDEAAFELLYREHVGSVYALCLRLTGDSERAGELVQDVFVQAWRKLPEFRGEASLATWLHRIAVNAARQSQRAETRRSARLVEDSGEVGRVAVPQRLVPGDRIDLERAIAGLPPQAREALVLHDIHGYRCREVAEMTGKAVGTIQAHLHRARRLLKEVLER